MRAHRRHERVAVVGAVERRPLAHPRDPAVEVHDPVGPGEQPARAAERRPQRRAEADLDGRRRAVREHAAERHDDRLVVDPRRDGLPVHADLAQAQPAEPGHDGVELDPVDARAGAVLRRDDDVAAKRARAHVEPRADRVGRPQGQAGAVDAAGHDRGRGGGQAALGLGLAGDQADRLAGRRRADGADRGRAGPQHDEQGDGGGERAADHPGHGVILPRRSRHTARHGERGGDGDRRPGRRPRPAPRDRGPAAGPAAAHRPGRPRVVPARRDRVPRGRPAARRRAAHRRPRRSSSSSGCVASSTSRSCPVARARACRAPRRASRAR